ncbi:MAG: rhodanese-like domain-containing protein [Solirubrobacterales bacterium]
MADEPKEISREEARKLVDEGAQLLDVRADHEWEAGRIAGATHVPLPQLPQRLGELDKDRPVVVYCRGGNRSSMATAALNDAGYEAVKLTEGVVGWEQEDLPMEPEGGYVAESGEAAAVLQARKQSDRSRS